MTEPIISVSGLRGIVGESLTPEIAIRYAAAFATVVPPGPIVIARDSRPSGRMLAGAINSGLEAVGRSTINAGIAATPTVGVLVRQHRAAGGIQISASHNPSAYNGMKLFASDGRVIPAKQGEMVLEQYRDGRPSWVAHDRLGTCDALADIQSEHLKLVLTTVRPEVIHKQKFRVVLDANHGAGGQLGRRLLEELGCDVTILSEEPDGNFAHTPEPTAENLGEVCRKVAEAGADIGFCQDPDADRLAVIDATGRYIGEEYTVALCVEHVLNHAKGPIVINCASSRMTQDIAEKAGVQLIRSAVGEANVVDAMLAAGAIFGGEGNGGPIDPRVGLVRDSFLGMALLLDAMAEHEMPIGAMADALPRYEIVKTKITLAKEKLPAALAALESHFHDAVADRMDGLRLDWPDRWLLVRGSNTEPIVRAIAEAPTAKEAKQLCKAAEQVLEVVRN
jgi:phosphomannomutase